MSNTSKHHTIIMLRQARSVLLKNKLSGGLTAGLLQHIKRLDSDIKHDEANSAKYDELMKVGKSAAESICERVAALQCDYDRLEELAGIDGIDEQINNLVESPEATELVELREAAGECESREDAEQRIQDDALEVTVRSDWRSLGETLEPTEFCILLSTGGPASRIVGELRDGEPNGARLEVQRLGHTLDRVP